LGKKQLKQKHQLENHNMATLAETIRKVRTSRLEQDEPIDDFSFFTPKATVEKPIKEIGSALKDIAVGTKKLFLPSRKDRLARIEKERGQTLLPEEAIKLIREEEKREFVVVADIDKFKPPEDVDFEKFLSRKAVSPIEGVGGLRRITSKAIKTLSQKIARFTKPKEVVEELRKFDIPEGNLKSLSESFAKETDALKIERLLTPRVGDTPRQISEAINVVKKKRVTPVARVAREVVEEVPPTRITKELEPLAKEARKFDTAEGFAKSTKIEFPKGTKQFFQPIKNALKLVDEFPNTKIEVFGSTAQLKRAALSERQSRNLFGITKTKPDLDIVVEDLVVSKHIKANENVIDFSGKVPRKQFIRDFGDTLDDAFKYNAFAEDVFFKVGNRFYEPTTVGYRWVEGADEIFKGAKPIRQTITDFFKQVKGEVAEAVPTERATTKFDSDIQAPIKTGETKTFSVQQTSALQGFEPKQVQLNGFEITELSGAAKFDLETAKELRKNPNLVPDFVAMKTMRDGRKVPAIRKTGIYAPKEFETSDFTDLKGVFGAQSFNFRDAAFSFDNVTARQASEEGSWGAMAYQQYATRNALAEVDVFAVTHAQKVKNIAQTNGVKINKKTGKELFDALDGKPVSSEINEIANQIRPILNNLRNQANVVRKEMGKTEIGFVGNYIPYMQRIDFWKKLMTDAKTEITDNFDFIIPNAKKNPHAIPRKEGAVVEDLETNAWKLIESYIANLSNDIHLSPQIERLKAVNEVIKGRGNGSMSNFMNKFIRENLVGKTPSIDLIFGFREGTRKKAILGRINMARNISALAGNIVWTVFVQPASLVGLTIPRAGGIKRGFQNTLGGIIDFAVNPTIRNRIRKLPTIVSKTSGASVGMTGAGDLDRMAGKIIKTRVESFNDFVGKLADANEYWLTGASSAAGYREAGKIGLKGKNADIFADWLGGATQSEYTKAARPLLLNNLVVRSTFPFQTFAFEMYRFSKTLVGLQGGIPLEKSERLNQAIMVLAGIYIYNEYTELTTGRRLTTLGSSIPIVGGAVDTMVAKGKEALGFRTGKRGFGRAPVAPQEDLTNFIEAVDAWINKGNIQPFRKEAIKWGLGFSGVAGASTINRFVDGVIADVRGFQTTRGGELAFPVTGNDRFIAPLLGVYSTQAGKEYLNQQQTAQLEKSKIMPIFKDVQDLLEEGRDAEAQAVVDALSTKDWQIYKKIKSAEQSRATQEGKVEIAPVFQEAQKLLEQGKQKEAQTLVDSLTEEEFKNYKLVKKQFQEFEKAKKGEQPSFPNESVESDSSIFETTFIYAKAIGTDPVTAFNRIFTGQRIRRVDSGAIIVERLPFRESQRIRAQKAEGEELNELRLDHTIPLQLGGSNSEKNLRLVPLGEWRSYTPIENHLGKLLRDGKIRKKEVQQLITDFKEGRVTAQTILDL